MPDQSGDDDERSAELKLFGSTAANIALGHFICPGPPAIINFSQTQANVVAMSASTPSWPNVLFGRYLKISLGLLAKKD